MSDPKFNAPRDRSERDEHLEAGLDRGASWLREAKRVLFITGAGLSADSGLPTYRGIGGLYEEADTPEGVPIEVALSGQMLSQNPDLCWRYIAQIEQACRGAEPNEGHRVIARCESRCETRVLTQNVDGLHRAAGSKELIEIHGRVHDIYCTRCPARRQVKNYAELEGPPRTAPRCPKCGAIQRPEVVLFGEMLPEEAVERLEFELAHGFDLIVSVGTSAGFPYIAAPVLYASRLGARSMEINPGSSSVTESVDLHLKMGAAEALAELERRAHG